MNKIYRPLAFLTLLFMLTVHGHAEVDVPPVGKAQKKAVKEGRAVGCLRPTAYNFLTINNVKSRINTGGNMWYPPGEDIPQYFVPAKSSKTSLFSGAIWVGGVDSYGQLKIAAQTFGTYGINYWTGPLTVDGTASVSEVTCAQYDKQWVITKEEVNLFRAWFASDDKENEFPDYQVPDVILNWPAHGNTQLKQSYYMAPFYDVDGDGTYNPLESGDYPYYDFANELCPNNFVGVAGYEPEPTPDTKDGTVIGGLLVDQVLKGDQTVWWVMNDKGNEHAAPDGAPIGLELRSQAFAFATNDEINNMTFFSFEIINRSTYTLTETYFAPWTDPDLGYAYDDYVGCDVGRGLGYCYNGKDVDGSGQVNAYGDQPPAVGIDFFQGPYMDPDGLDNPKYTYDSVGNDLVQTQVVDASINGVNFGNGIVDDERFGMRRFVYYNNDGSDNGNPDSPSDYYNYLRGIWRNNAKMQYGGDGFSAGAVGPEADFMFPGDSDPWNWGTGGNPPNGGYNTNGKYWTESQEGNPPADRRFVQSAGPFTLAPGAVNYITYGIPWARATSGGADASVKLLRVVDDKCQALFDNCFKILDGPDAPDMTIRELDKELIFLLSNDELSNNYNESYNEIDVTIVRPDSISSTAFDSTYTFEGYQIFQLRDAQVSVESLHDPAMARLVAQFDKKNGISKLVNYNYDESIGAAVPVVEVEGSDRGISNSFIITEDAFATGDNSLVNYKQYYFMAIAYAYNNFYPYAIDPSNPNGLLGQSKPYLAGRNNIQVYTAIPHQNLGGLQVNVAYGDQPEITRIEGKGNGGLHTKLTKETVDMILSKPPSDSTNRLGNPDYPIAYEATYEAGYGPIDLKIVDPLSVKNVDFELRLDSLVSDYRTQLTGYLSLVVDNTHDITDTASMMVAPWHLKDLTNDKEYHLDKTILTPTDRILPLYGLAINMQQVYLPGKYKVGEIPDNNAFANYYSVLAKQNGYVNSSVTYADADGSKLWLSGLKDTDDGTFSDWIRSGLAVTDVPVGTEKSMTKYDPDGVFEHVIEGTWAPLILTTDLSESGPSIFKNTSGTHGDHKLNMRQLSSLQIVFTNDKSKWTRSPVLEMQTNSALSEGNALAFGLRKALSVDKEGNPAAAGSGASSNPMDANYISDSGMGWFPGYAIDPETGERLNIVFGEDSWLSAHNGRDMKWNPTDKVVDPVSGEIVTGGKHYIYIFRTGPVAPKFFTAWPTDLVFPAYDAGAAVSALLKFIDKNYTNEMANLRVKRDLYSMVSWVSMPLVNTGHEILESDVTIDINIGRPYDRYFTYDSIDDDVTNYGQLNNHYPLYRFSTKSMIPTVSSNDEVIENALDEIRVVPNPYYAYNHYETEPLDNRVKLINLPEKCKISIYNLSGTQVRYYEKANSLTYLDWDLKNFAGVPISGGMYIIHVEADINGKTYEKVVKWLGMTRKADLNSF